MYKVMKMVNEYYNILRNMTTYLLQNILILLKITLTSQHKQESRQLKIALFFPTRPKTT